MSDYPRDGGTLVELFAGMAAVSWGAVGAVPPVRYQGGKRGYQARIRELLGVGRPDRVVLVEANPYVADALRVVWSPTARAEAIEFIRSWEAPPDLQRERWEAWRVEAHATRWADVGAVERGARWLWMQPRTVPFRSPPEVCRGDWLRDRMCDSQGRFSFSWRPHTPGDKLFTLPADVPPVQVVTGRAEDLPPIRGAVAYLDPPYPGTTGYGGAGLTWQQIAALALRWAAAGATVGVSVQLPVGLECHVLQRKGSATRFFGNTTETLSIFRPQGRRRR